MPPDYTIHDDEPKPAPEAGRKRSKLSDNLFEVAKTPGRRRRIATYSTAGTAATVASDLRSGKRAEHRPPGVWEFTTGLTDDGKHGVWARLVPEE